jgi:ribosome-binding factor A
MSSSYKRSERVAEELKREVSDIILRRIKDPSIGFVTLTFVQLTDDLKLAKIYFTVLGDKVKISETKKALNRAVGFIRSELRGRLDLKFIPEIKFYYDDTIEKATKIEELLNKIKSEKEN